VKRAVKIGLMNIPYVGKTVGTTADIEGLYAGLGFEVHDISRADIEAGLFHDYDMLHCPGGHHVELGPKGIRNLKRYIREGHGFFGICMGSHFIADAKILPLKTKIIRAHGIYSMRLVKRHPITRGFRLVPRSPERAGCNPVPHTEVGRIKVHRGNGAYLLAGKGVDVIGTYDNDDEFAGVVAGSLGRGRVCGISCHPQTVADASEGLQYRDLKTDSRLPKLIKNVALWCAGRSRKSEVGNRKSEVGG